MQTKQLLIPFLLFCLLASAFLPVFQAQGQSYLFNFEKWGGYIRIPSFSLTQAAVTSENTSERFQFNITLSRYRVQFTNISIPISRFGWTWHYQPPLNEELNLSEYTFVNATHAINGSDVLVYRPEKVVGSYAVYSNFSGNEYGIGKVLHLYRPLLIDANGNKIWGNINVTNGYLIIWADAAWMQNAVYPLVVDPTFGYTSEGASSNQVPAGWVYGGRYELTENGDITAISWYGSQWLSNGHTTTFIYSDDDGVPDALVATSSEEDTTTTTLWWNHTVSYSATAGYYWLIIFCENGLNWRFDSDGESYYRSGLTYPTMPNPWSGGGGQTNKVSIYATYTASGGASESFTLSQTITVTSSLATQKNLYRSFTQTVIIESDIYSIKWLTVTTSGTVTHTTIFAGSKAITAVVAEILETAALDASLSTVKWLTMVLSGTVTHTTIFSGSKSITAVVAEILETAQVQASLAAQKAIRAVLSGTVTVTSTLYIVKNLHALLVEIAETAGISGVLYAVFGVESTVEDALGLAAIALFVGLAAFALVVIRRRRD